MEASYYAQLPTALLLSPNLTCFQKLLYADIQSLTFQKGYCWASNSFLAERHNKSKEHISRQLAVLVENHHLFILDNKGGNGSVSKRRIYTESTFILYVQKKGLDINDFKIDKNIKAEEFKIDKNINHSNISKNLGKQGVPKGTHSSQSEQGSTLRESLKQTKKPVASKKVALHKETIELLDYWNSFASLTTHSLKRKRSVAPIHEQSKTVQNIDAAIYKLLLGTFYKKHESVHPTLQKRKWDIETVKKAIERMALACTPDYAANPKRASLLNFLFNPHVELGTGKYRYRYKYPFLHFTGNEPQPISDTPVRKKTEYPILVDKTLKRLTGTTAPTDRQYNQVVKQIDKAMLFINKVSNGKVAENRMKLPLMLRDTMLEENLPLTVDNLPLGVHNLEKFMRKRLMIT